MQAPPRDQVESVLADIVKEYLSRGEAVRVTGLGSFSVRHQNSSIERTGSGELKMRPPIDEIVFTPES